MKSVKEDGTAVYGIIVVVNCCLCVVLEKLCLLSKLSPIAVVRVGYCRIWHLEMMKFEKLLGNEVTSNQKQKRGTTRNDRGTNKTD